jgi:hypothetical protein
LGTAWEHPPRKRSIEERPLQTLHEVPAPHVHERDDTGHKNIQSYSKVVFPSHTRAVAESNFRAWEAPIDSSGLEKRRRMRQAETLSEFRMAFPTPGGLYGKTGEVFTLMRNKNMSRKVGKAEHRCDGHGACIPDLVVLCCNTRWNEG